MISCLYSIYVYRSDSKKRQGHMVSSCYTQFSSQETRGNQTTVLSIDRNEGSHREMKKTTREKRGPSMVKLAEAFLMSDICGLIGQNVFNFVLFLSYSHNSQLNKFNLHETPKRQVSCLPLPFA